MQLYNQKEESVLRIYKIGEMSDTMRNFIFATHGHLATGMKSSLELINGSNPRIYTLTAYVNGKDDLQHEVDEVCQKINKGGEWIVLTDLFGGSINNEFMNRLHSHDFQLIAGINLPLVLELISNDNEDADVSDLIEKAVSNAASTIQYCNPLQKAKLPEENF